MSVKPRKKVEQKDKALLRQQDLKAKIESLRNAKAMNLPGKWTEEDASEFIELIVELMQRDGDALNIYRPLKTADKFHECMAGEVGLSGSNQAGKTCTTSTEVAMAALGCHPVPGKYPPNNCKIACIGNDGRHLSLMYEYLFEKAPYKCFYHPDTGKWTVVEPDNPDHQKYELDWVEAPPVIPPRMVKNVSWINKKEKEPKSVRLHNGTVLRFYSGLVRKIPQGRKFHLIWIDEEIDNAHNWINELRARIQSLNGRILWSATPQNATEEFLNIQHKAEAPDNHELPDEQQSGFFVLLSANNPYISRKGREAFVAKLQNDDEQMQIRYFGVSARSYLLVYPEFKDRNLIPPINLRWEDTRYIIIDPGASTAAVLFACCPQLAKPKEELNEYEKMYRVTPGCVIIYDEILIKRASSVLVAQAIYEKLRTHPAGNLQDLTIDQRGGRSVRPKELNSDETLEGQYWKAIIAAGVKPRYDKGWKYGSYELKYGIDMTKEMLMPSDIDHPRLFITNNCKQTKHQFQGWKKKRDNKGNFIGYEEGYDLLACARYTTTRVAAESMGWVEPPVSAGLKQMTRSDYRKIYNDLKSGRGLY